MCKSLSKFIYYSLVGVVCLWIAIEIVSYSGQIKKCVDLGAGAYNLNCCPVGSAGLTCTYTNNAEHSMPFINRFLKKYFR